MDLPLASIYFLVSGMMLGPIQFLFSENINIYLQAFGNPSVDIFFKTISYIFSEPGYILLASLIFWCFSKNTGIRAMYVILFSAFTAIYAKNLFSMPRPPEYLHKIPENEFGFPSGHALVSSGFWGYMGYSVKNPRLIIAGAIIILFVSLSRIYLGVHYAGDVLGGIVFGLSLALLFFKIEPVVTNKLEKLNRISRYLAAVMLPVVLVAIAIMQRNLLKEQAEIGLVMAGIGVGYLLEEEHIGFTDATNNRQRVERAVAGAAVLGIIYFVSSMLLSINPDFIFFKYAALGFASTFIAPWLITKFEESVKNS